jgi:hypothetical protein
MISILIQIIIMLVVLGVLFWVIDQFPMPPPFHTVARVVLALIALLWVLYLLLPLAVGPPGLR